jgi:hypothetical protein
MLIELLALSSVALAGGGAVLANRRRVARATAPKAPAPVHVAGAPFVPEKRAPAARPIPKPIVAELRDEPPFQQPPQPGSLEAKAGVPIFAPRLLDLERV